ncbi:hypothetical protein AMTRI_Chr04g184170 [Amborella trichopoda]|uniref:Uncharacterized protein n=1 Tax=Amborella trichopoda TaxID=13333 RepID=W1NEK6_AMBTC|nr:transmembrane protein 45B [Amborella trichopoda]ERM93856.1 hypothetical protein AMTR_s00138p00105620 [Amborella trichopoda]|eukprot:XP_006826619.1 transmembrane protein 45B [Amborella trichopoda]
MGVGSLCVGGLGLIGIGAWQALTSATAFISSITHNTTRSNSNNNPPPSQLSAMAIISLLFLLNSLFSSLKGLQARDHLGFSVQLEVSVISSIFLLYSIAGLLSELTHLLPLSSPTLNLIALFAFAQEFLLFYLQRKDPTGLENRYFSLLLVPISVCLVSTFLQIGYPKSPFPSLARGAGLILQGTWFCQMGFSFYTNWMPHGCALYERSHGNYTIKCKGHAEYHMSKAVATLQFNCHLALLIVSLLCSYSLLCKKKFHHRENYSSYQPLNLKDQISELQELGDTNNGNGSNFILGSDGEDTPHAENPKHPHLFGVVPEANGFGNH